jgi:hypothetical protein
MRCARCASGETAFRACTQPEKATMQAAARPQPRPMRVFDRVIFSRIVAFQTRIDVIVYMNIKRFI